MPKPSSKTPQRITKMLAMHAAGGSAREIADELKVGHATVMRWLDDAGLKSNGGQGAREGRRRAAPNGEAAAMLDAQKRLAEMEVAAPSSDIPSMLTALHRELAEARAFITYHREGAKAGTSTMGDYDKATVIAERLATKIAELTPPGTVDPASDPSTLEAAAEVRRRLATLIDAAERVFKCKACGRNPFGRDGAG
jgi:hypothetical protein